MACSAEAIGAELGRDGDGEIRRLAGKSRVVAFWTLVSRCTGFGRVAVVAAVLGPTWFGNLFQLVAVLPPTVFSLFAGALLSALLVPMLVAHMANDDRARARLLADGTLGLLCALMLGLCVLGIVAAPVLLQALTSGVTDPAMRAGESQLGLQLVVLMLPQLALYGVVGIGMAVQQAHGAFGLAAGAPAVENLGVIAVFGVSALMFPTSPGGESLGTMHLAVLAGGSTLAVALHAGVQWWGARRLGFRLVPRAGWLDAELRGLARRGIASVGYNGLYWFGYLAAIVAASGVPGGAVAFQMAHSFCQVPIALTATPLATTQLPSLARIHGERRAAEFAAIYRAGIRLVLFAVLPVSLVLAVIPTTLASAAALGAMATPAGIAMVAAALGTLGLGVIGEAVVVVSTSAAYAGRNVGVPVQAMAARLAVVVAGVAALWGTPGSVELLWRVGATLAAGNLVAGLWLYVAQIRKLPPAAGRIGAAHVGGFAIQALSLVPALAVAGWLGNGHGGALYRAAVAVVAIGASLALYVGLHRMTGSRELDLLLPILARGRTRPRTRLR